MLLKQKKDAEKRTHLEATKERQNSILEDGSIDESDMVWKVADQEGFEKPTAASIRAEAASAAAALDEMNQSATFAKDLVGKMMGKIMGAVQAVQAGNPSEEQQMLAAVFNNYLATEKAVVDSSPKLGPYSVGAKLAAAAVGNATAQ